ncbi:ATP-binding protein [Phytohabitans aurantiacus]|uniref:SARP family transcriptional regulator n=1 Tax=Phytohabitans aurantiacus TaxID=3016789 RepID=A0ABQ5R008_9ACTN|nr:BTAD domain-containing putative transcriptional regulator [Phytohabitans aurantiacus]GLH99607.1 SARP family transcriptional regulator [Phytohabitans aurantiacus]
MVRIRLLGGVGATTAGGEPVDVGPARSQAVLAALALSAGTAVPQWRLVDLVWGDAPPRTAARTLQSYLTRLRTALGPGSIRRAGAAYLLDVPADAVDALRFQRRLDAGDAAGALAEWTGHPLAGLTAPGLAPAVDGLVERWLAAVEADLGARVDATPSTAIGPLTDLTARYPHREGLWALLMTAQYRCGRQVDALAAYRTARGHLVDGLGVEPGPRLRALEARILAEGGENERGNLPRRPGRLVGRDGALKAVEEAIAGYPVVTLVGPGGIGKTRLAIAAALRVDGVDGAWLVDLSQIGAAADVPRAVAAPFGVTETAGRSLAESIVAALRSRRALLVLDNCEHVVAAVAPLAQAIVEGCPDVQVLATSREGLGLGHGHERLLTVAPLDLPDAVQLFEERAAAVCGTADRETAERVCARLDGVPLAIELAAARTATFSAAELLSTLDDLLAGGPRTAAARHRTLRATIEWSYALLTPRQRGYLETLSVFPAPFDRAAAAAVAGGDVDVLDELVARSMVLVEAGPRFRLLSTIRRFAGERLAAAGRAGRFAARHARWCRDELRRVQARLAGPDEVEGVARLDELWPHLRAAFAWACERDHDIAYALLRPVAAEIGLRGRCEVGDWAERLLDRAGAAAPALLAWAGKRYGMNQHPAGYERLVERHGEPDQPLVRHGRGSAYQDYGTLGELAPAAAAEWRRRGDGLLAEQADVDAGAALLFTGRFVEHDAVVGALAERYRAGGPPTLLNWTLMLLGYSAACQGERERAERLFDEAVAVRVPDHTHSPNKPVRARALLRRGDRAGAFGLLRSHVDELLDTGNMQGTCVAAVEFVTMMAAVGRLPDAARVLGYVEGAGMLDVEVWRAQVTEVSATLTTAGDQRRAGRAMSHDDALRHMRAVLDGLLRR